ncbi:UNVERIFIED_CONTAM: hypothetical protein HDU68_002503 [Siphonaria sp. JEL0065]|nr:hypothetical protein HDU68_002503 [Siphonaria sp. JEL0065]
MKTSSFEKEYGSQKERCRDLEKSHRRDNIHRDTLDTFVNGALKVMGNAAVGNGAGAVNAALDAVQKIAPAVVKAAVAPSAIATESNSGGNSVSTADSSISVIPVTASSTSPSVLNSCPVNCTIDFYKSISVASAPQDASKFINLICSESASSADTSSPFSQCILARCGSSSVSGAISDLCSTSTTLLSALQLAGATASAGIKRELEVAIVQRDEAAEAIVKKRENRNDSGDSRNVQLVLLVTFVGLLFYFL